MKNPTPHLENHPLLLSATFWGLLILFNGLTTIWVMRSDAIDFFLFGFLPLLGLWVLRKTFSVKLSALFWIIPAGGFLGLMGVFIYDKASHWGGFLYDYFPALGQSFIISKLNDKGLAWPVYLAVSAGVTEELFFRYIPWRFYIKDQAFSWRKWLAYFTWGTVFFAMIHFNQGLTQIFASAVTGLYLSLLMLLLPRYSLLWLTHAFVDGFIYWRFMQH